MRCFWAMQLLNTRAKPTLVMKDWWEYPYMIWKWKGKWLRTRDSRFGNSEINNTGAHVHKAHWFFIKYGAFKWIIMVCSVRCSVYDVCRHTAHSHWCYFWVMNNTNFVFIRSICGFAIVANATIRRKVLPTILDGFSCVIWIMDSWNGNHWMNSSKFHSLPFEWRVGLIHSTICSV